MQNYTGHTGKFASTARHFEISAITILVSGSLKIMKMNNVFAQSPRVPAQNNVQNRDFSKFSFWGP